MPVERATLPETHIFVCVNTRVDTGLGEGCGDRGERVWEALRREVVARRKLATVWITRSHCIGICPKAGATLATFPRRAILSGVLPEDAARVLDDAMKHDKECRDR